MFGSFKINKKQKYQMRFSYKLRRVFILLI